MPCSGSAGSGNIPHPGCSSLHPTSDLNPHLWLLLPKQQYQGSGFPVHQRENLQGKEEGL